MEIVKLDYKLRIIPTDDNDGDDDKRSFGQTGILVAIRAIDWMQTLEKTWLDKY